MPKTVPAPLGSVKKNARYNGFALFPGNMAKDIDVYYDDVAISGKPIGPLAAAP